MQRIFLAAVLVVAVALPCHAQGDKPKPNTLTPKEIADGWILLFDGETTFGWGHRPHVAITAGEGALSAAEDAQFGFLSPWGDFELVFEYRGRPLLSIQDAGRKAEGAGLAMNASDDWKTVSLQVGPGQIAYSSGQTARWKGDPAAIGFNAVYGKISIRNIKLRPLNMQPLFNGTELTGWKVFPGEKYKSKFTVADGAINVKNGPGDLQTTGKYKDFVLQLECKSNGPHLNSGIFFRCRDNEYQNGYECQIRNQFHDKPDQKYTIEEYDPKTNKLIGKKDVMFAAVDYGTGAIYRRQPARKEMSKDGEWFTMTIVAHGNHLATWVNGVQVTDWTDNRPKSDNARTGCKLDVGHISIQGHDPTTDLSFRNIRIAEFK